MDENGLPHGAPAVIFPNGHAYAFKHGLYEGSRGSVQYIYDGVLHRVSGPAVVYDNGKVEWWFKGQRIDANSLQEFELAVGLHKPNPPKALSEYQVSPPKLTWEELLNSGPLCLMEFEIQRKTGIDLPEVRRLLIDLAKERPECVDKNVYHRCEEYPIWVLTYHDTIDFDECPECQEEVDQEDYGLEYVLALR